MTDAIGDAKAELTHSRDRLLKGLQTTPDDRINWAPASTARTPLQQVAHAALAIGGIQSMLQGEPFPFADLKVADAEFRKMELPYDTREKVVDLLNGNVNAFLAFLDAMTPEELAGSWSSVMGTFPMCVAITFPADHARGHVAQLEYMQTCYGDMDWHMGG